METSPESAPTPAGLGSAQLSQGDISVSSFWAFLGKRRWILEILHEQMTLGRLDAAVLLIRVPVKRAV